MQSSGRTGPPRKKPAVLTGVEVNAALVRQMKPDLLVWAAGSIQNIPNIPGIENQHCLTSIEYLSGENKISGPRVLVIGAGKTGLEIAERMGQEGYEVVATKRTDPLGGTMDTITKSLILKRIGETGNVTLMPRTTVKAFAEKQVDINTTENSVIWCQWRQKTGPLWRRKWGHVGTPV